VKIKVRMKVKKKIKIKLKVQKPKEPLLKITTVNYEKNIDESL